MKALLAILVVALLSAGGAAAAAPRSGLRGTVLVAPATPVCKQPTQCTRPDPHALLRFWRNGRVVAHTRSNAEGSYRIALRPRTYTVTSTNGAVIVPGRVTVAADSYRRVTFKLDTGIR